MLWVSHPPSFSFGGPINQNQNSVLQPFPLACTLKWAAHIENATFSPKYRTFGSLHAGMSIQEQIAFSFHSNAILKLEPDQGHLFRSAPKCCVFTWLNKPPHHRKMDQSFIKIVLWVKTSILLFGWYRKYSVA